MKLFKIDKDDADDIVSVVESMDDGGIVTKIPVSELVCQPRNKCCISCGGYTMGLLSEDDSTLDEHSKKFCFMCLFEGKADE